MSARGLAIAASVVTLLGGLLALLSPAQTMPWVGFRALSDAELAWALGEIRGTYGGLFVVLGAYGLHAALDPAARRARLFMLGLCWWGVALGRLTGASIDGSPGLYGWVYFGFETVMGGLFVASATLASDDSVPAAPVV